MKVAQSGGENERGTRQGEQRKQMQHHSNGQVANRSGARDETTDRDVGDRERGQTKERLTGGSLSWAGGDVGRLQHKTDARFRGETCRRHSRSIDTSGGNLDRVGSGGGAGVRAHRDQRRRRQNGRWEDVRGRSRAAGGEGQRVMVSVGQL